MNFYDKALNSGEKIFAVAPMLDWSDRHCRFLHRLLTRQSLLYTEMVVADAAIHGPRERLLGFDPSEHKLALQLGGSDPEKLVEAMKIALDFGYDEINLNVGCPSDRVQSGTFGACLMREPDTVARCISAMKRISPVPVTVKCRIGVDDQDPEAVLPDFLARMVAAGADAIWIHARKAWLQGLSPKENRDIPPLDYALVHRMKRENPTVFLGINGGIQTIGEAVSHLAHMDGVMLGRAAYHHAAILGDVDAAVYGDAPVPVNWDDIRDRMIAYCERHMSRGGRLNNVTRHMVGLFQSVPGARRFRQILSTGATRPDAQPELIAEAFAAINLTGAGEP